MRFSKKGLIAVIFFVVLGAAIGWGLGEVLKPKYRPVTMLSVGLVTNTLPGVEGPALYAGDILTYTSTLCLNATTSTRAQVTIYWRQYEPSIRRLPDPVVDDWTISIPAGCDRKPQRYMLPDFITPGFWALEAKIIVNAGKDKSQTTDFATTRFQVILKP